MDTPEKNEEGALNIQNEFFNNARKNHTRLTVFLTNGQRISGLIRSFDKFTVILETRNGDQMVFKHAITAVAASRPGEEEFRGPRPPRPHGAERAGDHRPFAGGGRPPQHGPGPGGRPGPRDAGRGGPPPRDAGGPRPEGDHRPRASAGPQGKTFGNFMDLSSLKGGAEAPPAPPAPEAPPAATHEAKAPAPDGGPAPAAPDPDRPAPPTETPGGSGS